MGATTRVEQANYGTWIRVGRLRAFGVASTLSGVGACLTFVSAWFALLLVPAALFGYIAIVLALTISRLGPRGGDYRRRIHELIVAKASPERAGDGLDVGCGS